MIWEEYYSALKNSRPRIRIEERIGLRGIPEFWPFCKVHIRLEITLKTIISNIRNIQRFRIFVDHPKFFCFSYLLIFEQNILGLILGTKIN